MTRCTLKIGEQSQAEFILVEASAALRLLRQLSVLFFDSVLPGFEAWKCRGEHAPCRAR